MANPDGPRGFTVAGRLGGGEPHYKEYYIDGDLATACFIGDIMEKESDGGTGPEDVSRADVCTASVGADTLGVAIALYNSSRKPVKYLAASTAGYALICDDPKAIYVAQCDDAGTAITAAACGDQTDAVWTHAGSTSTGRAGVELDQDGLVGDGSNAMFSIIDRVDTPNNDWGSNVKLYVVLAEQALQFPFVAI